MTDWIKARRSIRKYTAEPVSDEYIQALLEAAMAAPSASNRKPWEFVVVREAALRHELGAVHQWSGMAADAPVVFVVLGRNADTREHRHWVEDCSAATENLLLAATTLGLGAVWIGIYPDVDREIKVRALVKAPESHRPLCLIAVGHPAETHPARTQYDAARVHQETF